RHVARRGHDAGVLPGEGLEPPLVAGGGPDLRPLASQSQRGDASDAGGRAGDDHAGGVEIHATPPLRGGAVCSTRWPPQPTRRVGSRRSATDVHASTSAGTKQPAPSTQAAWSVSAS